LYLKILLKGVNPNEKIHYLVVDEAQDHSPAEIFILKKFADTGRTMIVGDLLQGIINPNGIESWEDIMEKMYDKARTEFFRIKTSYRSTKSIIEFVNEYLNNREIPLNHLPRPVLREGKKPTVYTEEELEDIIERIIQITNWEIQDSRHNIAIIVPEKFIDLFAEALSKKLPQLTLLNNNTKYDGGIAFGHVRTFKGLEFDTVIFINIAETIDPQIQNKNFYVACTRAMHSLYIIDN
jgi:DNA helicase-2/ATP-dependent DNA helicase PcrA